MQQAARIFANASGALLAGMLAAASWAFVASELDAGRELAYGLPVWAVQVLMPVGFAILAVRLGARGAGRAWVGVLTGTGLAAAGFLFARHFDGSSLPLLPFVLWLVAVLLAGAPVFAALGGLALALFWSEGQPLASVPLSHYQITVNPSLPALPLFTLAGLVFARSGAAARLGAPTPSCWPGRRCRLRWRQRLSRRLSGFSAGASMAAWKPRRSATPFCCKKAANGCAPTA